MHCQNRAERAICTFKDHFLAILAGINSALHHTFGTFFCHRLNSPSIFSVMPLSIQGLVHENFSKGPLTSTRRQLVQLAVVFSSMQSRLLGNHGTSAQNQASILARPLIPTTASSWSSLTPKAKSSEIHSNFAICTSLSLCLLSKIRSFTAYRLLQARSGAHHLQQVSPNLKLSLLFRKSLSHGVRLLPHPYGLHAAQLLHLQG
jgi:hypothetical protein